MPEESRGSSAGGGRSTASDPGRARFPSRGYLPFGDGLLALHGSRRLRVFLAPGLPASARKTRPLSGGPALGAALPADTPRATPIGHSHDICHRDTSPRDTSHQDTSHRGELLNERYVRKSYRCQGRCFRGTLFGVSITGEGEECPSPSTYENTSDVRAGGFRGTSRGGHPFRLTRHHGARGGPSGGRNRSSSGRAAAQTPPGHRPESPTSPRRVRQEQRKRGEVDGSIEGADGGQS